MDEQYIFPMDEGTQEVKGQGTKTQSYWMPYAHDEMIDIIVLPRRRFIISIMAEEKKMFLSWMTKSFIYSAIFDIRRS